MGNMLWATILIPKLIAVLIWMQYFIVAYSCATPYSTQLKPAIKSSYGLGRVIISKERNPIVQNPKSFLVMLAFVPMRVYFLVLGLTENRFSLFEGSSSRVVSYEKRKIHKP